MCSRGRALRPSLRSRAHVAARVALALCARGLPCSRWPPLLRSPTLDTVTDMGAPITTLHGLVVPSSDEPITIGRYVLHAEIARGGMATIHIARLLGDEGFSRIVAGKRLHPEFAQDEEFVAMLLDEARIASKVKHRNVVPVLDVVTADHEVMLVQEYVHGAPLSALLRYARQRKHQLPVNLAVAIACQVLSGLHATHETADELGEPMHIVHRDVSPQNVMLAVDGSARLLDFGVAKAVMASHVTREGTYKGKLAYSAPEQMRGAATRQSDIYSLSVLLWELLVGERMHGTRSGAELVSAVMKGALPSISEALSQANVWSSLGASERKQLQALEPIVRKGLCVDLGGRWTTASEMEEALAAAVRPARGRALTEWVKTGGKDFLERREAVIAAEEECWRLRHPAGGPRPSVSSTPRTGINARVPDASASDAPDAPSILAMRRRPRAHRAAAGAALLLSVVGLVALVTTSKTHPPQTAIAAGASADAQRAQTAPVPAALRPPSAPEPARPSLALPAKKHPLDTDERPPAADPAQTASESALEPKQAASEPKRTASVPVSEPRRATNATVIEPRARRASNESAHRLDHRARPVHPTVEPTAASDPPPPPPAAQPNKCDVPYYFEGKKKIFKSSCI